MNYTITVEEKCQECKDTGGKVSHPLWAKYGEELAASGLEAKFRNMTPFDALAAEAKFAVEFWMRQGYDIDDPRNPWHSAPPDVIDCPKCGGTGTYTRRATLDELLAMLEAEKGAA